MDWQTRFGVKIVADILNRPLCQGTGEQASERAGVGAAMVAGIGSGVFDGYQDAQKLAPSFNVMTEPNRTRALKRAFTDSVMIDASREPFEENAFLTDRQVCRALRGFEKNRHPFLEQLLNQRVNLGFGDAGPVPSLRQRLSRLRTETLWKVKQGFNSKYSFLSGERRSALKRAGRLPT